jgi:hypothetical protein
MSELSVNDKLKFFRRLEIVDPLKIEVTPVDDEGNTSATLFY